MPKQDDVVIEVRLNVEGDWPRSAYQQHCQRDGIDYTEEGYLRWRAVGERLSGCQSFETAVQRASAAFASLGVTFAEATKSMVDAFKRR